MMNDTSILLGQAGIRANTFHSGSFCSLATFDEDTPHGHLHLLRSGRLTLALRDGASIAVTEPTLIFFPGPYSHRILATQQDEAELVCATLHCTGGLGNPLTSALPPYLVLPLSQMPLLHDTLEWLFSEALGDAYGSEAATDRLFELLLIQLLRHRLSQGALLPGALAGMADARIARALKLMHAHPERPLQVEALARLAGMSHASFCATFKRLVGQSPAHYLAGWRVNLAQKLLREGMAISAITALVGYESPSALARAFRRRTSLSPREWLAQR